MKRLLICAALMGSTLTVHAQDNNRELKLQALKIRIEALDNQFADLVSRDEASKGMALEIMTGSAECSGLYSAVGEHIGTMEGLSAVAKDAFRTVGRDGVVAHFKKLSDIEYNMAKGVWQGTRSANPSNDIDGVKGRTQLHYQSVLDAEGETSSEVEKKMKTCSRRGEAVFLTYQKIIKSFHKNLERDPEYQEWRKQFKEIDPDLIREHRLRARKEKQRAQSSLMGPPYAP